MWPCRVHTTRACLDSSTWLHLTFSTSWSLWGSDVVVYVLAVVKELNIFCHCPRDALCVAEEPALCKSPSLQCDSCCPWARHVLPHPWTIGDAMRPCAWLLGEQEAAWRKKSSAAGLSRHVHWWPGQQLCAALTVPLVDCSLSADDTFWVFNYPRLYATHDVTHSDPLRLIVDTNSPRPHSNTFLLSRSLTRFLR